MYSSLKFFGSEEAEVTVERFREAHPVEYEVVKDVMVTIVIMTFAPEPFIGIINIIGFGRFGPVLRRSLVLHQLC